VRSSGRIVAAAILLVGCGRIGFETRAGGGDDAGGDGGFAATRMAYIKASNTEAEDTFGESIALSADGTTLAVGAYWEDSAATGIDNNQADNSAGSSGAVYVFVRNGATWTQQAYVKSSNSGPGDWFGSRVALSADGNTLAVGAPLEASSATGINGNQADNGAMSSGAAYVFTRTGTTWTQQAYVKASNTGVADSYGQGIALSGDGNTLAVGAMGEASSAPGIDGDQGSNAAANSGAVYVYTRAGVVWTQQAYVKASVPRVQNVFGATIALSTTGDTMVVGSPGESSNATGVDGNPNNATELASGAAYVFTRVGTTWTPQAYLKAPNTRATNVFGSGLAITGDGDTIAIGATGENSSATGIDGNPNDLSAGGSGAVFVFHRAGATWTQQSYVKASNTNGGDKFGITSLSTDGLTLAVGAYYESSAATGFDGDQLDNTAIRAGAVYVFTRMGTSWRQVSYIKASNTDPEDTFGLSLAVSGDGAVLAATAKVEASASTGIDGDQSDNSATDSGAVYVFY
jgi:hypothetical protein